MSDYDKPLTDEEKALIDRSYNDLQKIIANGRSASSRSAGLMSKIVSSDGSIMNLSCGHWLMLADGEDAAFLVGASTKCRVCKRQNDQRVAPATEADARNQK